MAFQPVPVQAHYLGYGMTSGADFMHYLITDPIYMPPKMEEYCSEKLVYLPGTFMATTRPPISEDQVARADYLLPEESFVFCNFNQPAKFEPTIFSAWMRILRSVPSSVLWLCDFTTATQRNLRREAAARGIEPDRLVFAEFEKHPRHLKRLELADLALDNLFHGGGVTTVDCLWAGVPLLTVAGKTPPSRLGATLLTAAGMPELIMGSLEDYEDMALELAQNPDRIKAVRQKLWSQRLTCPLFDTARYVRHLETGYALMWQNHLDGNPPRQFRIEA